MKKIGHWIQIIILLISNFSFSSQYPTLEERELISGSKDNHGDIVKRYKDGSTVSIKPRHKEKEYNLASGHLYKENRHGEVQQQWPDGSKYTKNQHDEIKFESGDKNFKVKGSRLSSFTGLSKVDIEYIKEKALSFDPNNLVYSILPGVTSRTITRLKDRKVKSHVKGFNGTFEIKYIDGGTFSRCIRGEIICNLPKQGYYYRKEVNLAMERKWPDGSEFARNVAACCKFTKDNKVLEWHELNTFYGSNSGFSSEEIARIKDNAYSFDENNLVYSILPEVTLPTASSSVAKEKKKKEQEPQKGSSTANTTSSSVKTLNNSSAIKEEEGPNQRYDDSKVKIDEYKKLKATIVRQKTKLGDYLLPEWNFIKLCNDNALFSLLCEENGIEFIEWVDNTKDAIDMCGAKALFFALMIVNRLPLSVITKYENKKDPFWSNGTIKKFFMDIGNKDDFIPKFREAKKNYDLSDKQGADDDSEDYLRLLSNIVYVENPGIITKDTDYPALISHQKEFFSNLRYAFVVLVKEKDSLNQVLISKSTIKNDGKSEIKVCVVATEKISPNLKKFVNKFFGDKDSSELELEKEILKLITGRGYPEKSHEEVLGELGIRLRHYKPDLPSTNDTGANGGGPTTIKTEKKIEEKIEKPILSTIDKISIYLKGLFLSIIYMPLALFKALLFFLSKHNHKQG